MAHIWIKFSTYIIVYLNIFDIQKRMDSGEIDWNYWRSFLAVLQEGSLSAAAKKLQLTQPTLGRHIEGLENMLGAKLFLRSVRGLSPTDTALALRSHAETMDAAAKTLVRAASGPADKISGTIRITASEYVGAQVLPRILTPFMDAHPGIAIELMLSDRTDDLSRREADIAIRMVAPTQAALVGRKLGKVRIALYAHKDYVARHGLPDSLRGDLSAHRFVGYDADTRSLAAIHAAGLEFTRDVFSLRADRDAAQTALVKSGTGIGGCQVPTARRDPNLVPVLHDEFGFNLEMWLVMHEDLSKIARMRALFDHLAEGLGAYLNV